MLKNVITVASQDLEEFEQYLYERENARATIRKYMTDIRTFCRYLGKEKEADKNRLLLYKEWLLEHYAISSANSMLAALNQFLKFKGYDSMTVKRIKTQRSLFRQEEKELTKGEFKRLVEAARRQGKEQLALCMETIAVTGIRISELQYFTVERVKKGRIEIINKGKYRRIFLPDSLRKKLLVYSKERGIRGGCIFITRNGKPKDRSNIWSEMKALQKKTGIQESKIFPHNFRHLFARVYYDTTKDLVGLADLLGHSSLNVTRVYTSTSGQMYQRQLNRMKDLQI